MSVFATLMRGEKDRTDYMRKPVFINVILPFPK